MHYFASDYLSFPVLDLKSFHVLTAETHRCCLFVAEYSPRVADCLDHSHLAQSKSEMAQRTYLREVAATVVAVGVNFVGMVGIVAVVNFVLGFAVPVAVPKLLGLGFVVVFVECPRGKEILCDVIVSSSEVVR